MHAVHVRFRVALGVWVWYVPAAQAAAQGVQLGAFGALLNVFAPHGEQTRFTLEDGVFDTY